MAGANKSAHFKRPYRWWSIHHASQAPGVDTGMAPTGGKEPFLARERAISRVSLRGDAPDPARPTTLPCLGSHNMTKQSPPNPLDVGSRKPRQAFMAMAASTADPPRLRISMPVWVANGCAVPAAPEVPYTAVRD